MPPASLDIKRMSVLKYRLYGYIPFRTAVAKEKLSQLLEKIKILDLLCSTIKVIMISVIKLLVKKSGNPELKTNSQVHVMD